MREKPHERYRERRGNVLCSRCVLFSVLQVHVHLMDTLKESLEGIQDKVTYQQHGKSLMQNYAGSHWQQRYHALLPRLCQAQDAGAGTESGETGGCCRMVHCVRVSVPQDS